MCFVLKMMFAYYICCIYLDTLQTTFIITANSMKLDKTAPIAVLSQSIMFVIKSITNLKAHWQTKTDNIVLNVRTKNKK